MVNSSHEHLLQASIFLKVARSHKVKIPGASAKTSGRIFTVVLMDGTPSTHRCKEENNAKATSLSTWLGFSMVGQDIMGEDKSWLHRTNPNIGGRIIPFQITLPMLSW